MGIVSSRTGIAFPCVKLTSKIKRTYMAPVAIVYKVPYRQQRNLHSNIMTEKFPISDYADASRDEILEELERLRARNAETRREMKRSQVIANMVRKLYRIEYMEVPAAELAGVFLELVAQSLSIDRAALLKQAPGGCFEVLHLLHDEKRAGKKVLEETEFVDGFAYVNASTPDSSFKFQLKKLLAADAFLWDYDEESGLALAIGNSSEESENQWRFDAGDRETVELASERLCKRGRTQSR